MNKYNAEVLAARINHALEAGPTFGSKIKKRLLLEGAKGDTATLKECLIEWEARGLLKVLKKVDECASEDDCVEMLSFVGEKSPFKGWLNWQ